MCEPLVPPMNVEGRPSSAFVRSVQGPDVLTTTSAAMANSPVSPSRTRTPSSSRPTAARWLRARLRAGREPVEEHVEGEALGIVHARVVVGGGVLHGGVQRGQFREGPPWKRCRGTAPPSRENAS